ncbi:MAG TPA: hypothetical protein VKU02_24920 [Gemmataceae bacterium]|nr:hypothetical protein [Gemmataceae bacterium]
MLTIVLALLGSAGSAAATWVTGWLTPILVGASILFLGRAFYALYVKRNGTRATKIITWFSFTFVVVFWMWRLFLV